MEPSSEQDRLHLTIGDVLDAVDESFVALDREFRFVYLNRAAKLVFARSGQGGADLVGRGLWDVFPELFGSTLGARYRDAMAASSRVEFEEFSPISRRWYGFRAVPSAHGLSLFVRDVTQERTALEELRAGKARLRSVVDHAADGILLTAVDGRILSANPAACRMLGRTETEICRGGREQIVDTSDPRLPVLLGEREQSGAAEGELDFVRGDGTKISVQVTSVVFRDAGGELRTSMTLRDLTEQKRQQAIQAELLRTVRESEELFRVMVEHAPVGLALVTPDTRIARVNERLCEILGFERAELVGRTVAEITHPEDLGASEEFVRGVLVGEANRDGLAKRYIRKDGATVEAQIHVSLVRDDQGEPRIVIAQIQDVTETRRLEAKLALADRMASVGTLASGIAHEINNPLTYVVSNLDNVLDELGRAGPSAAPQRSVISALEEARLGAERVRRIVRELRALTRTGEDATDSLDVHEMLEVALRMTGNQIRHRARLIRAFEPVPRVEASGSRLVQVFVNLLFNAAQAIDEGRTDGNMVRVRTYTDDGGHAVVEVSDTGRGVPHALRSRIFDPFFTTKAVGVGMGLGLSIAHTIVSALGGIIEVQNNIGPGATFRVVLPPGKARVNVAAREPNADSDASTPPEEAVERRARVLIVDDDELVARVLARSLAKKHDVTIVQQGGDAVARIAAGERYTTIFCDVMMPDKAGTAVLADIQRIEPEQAARVVFVTGGVFSPSVAAALESVTNRVLEKPVARETLFEIIEAWLAVEPS